MIYAGVDMNKRASNNVGYTFLKKVRKLCLYK